MPGEWTNIAFSWHKSEPLTFYVNGLERAPSALTITNQTSADTDTLFVIGRRNNALNGYYAFTMHNLVVWDRYLYPKHVHKMMGITGECLFFKYRVIYFW